MPNKESITGLDKATDRKSAEYDIVKALLEASEMKTADDNITKVDIKRAGKYLFTVSIHPLAEPDIRSARKKATVYAKNKQNKNQLIEKDFDVAKFNSWLIYLATTEEDQERIWGNPTIMQKFNLMQPWESIDILLAFGEKRKLADLVLEISGMDDDEETVNDEEFRDSAD